MLKLSRSLLATAIVDDKNHQTVVHEVVAKMIQDSYALIIKTDKLLLTYGAAMYEKEGPKRRSKISYKLKSLAKLLEVFQEESKNANSNAFDLIDPKNWDTLIASAKTLTKYDGDRVGTPSLFLKLGYSLQHMARVARAIALKTEDETLLKKSKSFLDLYESEWTVYSTRIRIQFDESRNKAPQEIPLAEDIKTLRNFCQEEIDKFVRNGDVTKVILLLLLHFIRRCLIGVK